jgi:uncharacterized protein with PQ loop repeat
VINLTLQIIAVLATAFAWVPQVTKSLKSADRRGLSGASWTLGAVVALVYVLYGISAHIWSLLLSEAAFALGACWVVATLIGWRRVGLFTIAVLTPSVPLVLFASATTIGILGVIGAVSMRLFQSAKALRTRTAAGVSAGAWALLSINVTAWGLYGWRTHHWPLVATAVLTLAASISVLATNRMISHQTTTLPIAAEQ